MPSPENPADLVITGEADTRVEFSDLSERRAVKLSALTRYVSRAHFQTWEGLRRMPDFDDLQGIFTPLVLIELEASDARVQPGELLHARGEGVLGKVLDTDGSVRNVTRDSLHRVFTDDGRTIGSVRFVNVFTRYDTDPARRKVRELPPELGLGALPSNVTELPTVQTMLPLDRPPDFPEGEPAAWYYAQTDPNRHVNSIAYLHVAQEYAATRLHQAGHRLDRLWASRARVCFRKPCFRGEEYRRLAWRTGDDPPVVGVAIAKCSDPEGHPPATAIELTLSEHEEG